MPTTNSPTRAEIEKAADILRSGGLVAFPTETVYGLGANALDAAAVQKIYAAKGRPATSPLIVHVASMEMALSVAAEWPEAAATLAERFWPGPLTIILRKRKEIPGIVTAGLQTVGIRMPSHPVALDLIRCANLPVAAPSANRFTQLSPTQARHVREGLGENVAYVLDGGGTNVGIESTVVSLAEGRNQLLRPGIISISEIEAMIGPVSRPPDPESGAHSSPGTHPRHYSPATRLVVTRELPTGRGAYLWRDREIPCGLAIRMPADPAGYARELYAVLHRLDADELDYIAVEPLPETEEWAGIRDRLVRASS